MNRSSSSVSLSLKPGLVSSKSTSPRLSPLLPSATVAYNEKSGSTINGAIAQLDNQRQPTIFGIPLKYISLVTLAVQNATLSIVMHYSRVSIPPHLAYSPASAVLLNELLKGFISFLIAIAHSPILADPSPATRHRKTPLSLVRDYLSAAYEVWCDVLSPDCWKLSIPAMLYVVQNSLQFVAVSNLPVATFQVTYQMKILTTAAFSVALLRKRLTVTKWLSLFFLAIGVGIVQIQSMVPPHRQHIPKDASAVGSAHEYHVHVMNQWKGFGAVTAACFTSGLAGVYFEMVLKGSKANLWTRNVQLSLFSLIPAFLPVLYGSGGQGREFFTDVFRNFGGWAWATVFIQVLGGLITALVIKYSDNILKGFATSLSIVLSFLASVVLFDFQITISFIVGASTVLCATWMYNQPGDTFGDPKFTLSVPGTSGKTTPVAFPPTPTDSPIIGEFGRKEKKEKGGVFTSSTQQFAGVGHVNGHMGFGETLDTSRYHEAPYGSPFSSRPPSRIPSRAHSPALDSKS